jgi:hypothetical protein
LPLETIVGVWCYLYIISETQYNHATSCIRIRVTKAAKRLNDVMVPRGKSGHRRESDASNLLQYISREGF